ncbi:MAG: 2-phosphosulfolactate phosphatase [Bacteroidota bacterium]
MHTLHCALTGLQSIPSYTDAIVIIDVLSFTSCVEIALTNGGKVYPYRWKDASAEIYAQQKGIPLARKREVSGNGFSLSPSSMTNIQSGQGIVLPSPNGSTLTVEAANTGKPVYAACLRNAEAVAGHLNQYYKEVAVIAGMEQWPNGQTRFALEDWLGAGAVLNGLIGEKSPNARAAMASFQAVESRLKQELLACFSGKELIERGYEEDVLLASVWNVSQTIPQYSGDSYQSFES